MTEHPRTDDAPKIEDKTSAKELVTFTRKRIREPHVFPEQNIIVWDFNSHHPDEEALQTAVEQKLRRGRYIIPFQVTGAWTFMVGLLPQPVREAEILIYRSHLSEYYAYRNLYDMFPDESRDQFRQETAQSVYDFIADSEDIDHWEWNYE